MKNEVDEKGLRYQKLTEAQKASNRNKSRQRARVEHVFGFMTNSMKEMYIKTIDYARTTAKIGFANLT